jgi:hypothetical protein
MNFPASTTTRVTSPLPTSFAPCRAATVKRTRRPSAYDEEAVTVTSAPTALAARCSRVTRVPTLVLPAGSVGSIAAQVTASHQASSRGVPSTGRLPEPTASAVSADVTVKVRVASSGPAAVSMGAV